MLMKSVDEKVKNKVEKYHELETKLTVMENQLSENKQFREFINLQKQVNAKAAEVWAEVAQIMIDAKKKTVDTDWVKLTIVDAKKLDIDTEKLDEEFYKVVPDTTKINDYIKENKKTPKGVKQIDAPYLRKSFRDFVS